MPTWLTTVQERGATFLGSGAGLLTTAGFTLACYTMIPWLGWEVASITRTDVLSITAMLATQLVLGRQLRQECAEEERKQAADAFYAKQERAINEKLDELIKAIPAASNDLRGIERDD